MKSQWLNGVFLKKEIKFLDFLNSFSLNFVKNLFLAIFIFNSRSRSVLKTAFINLKLNKQKPIRKSNKRGTEVFIKKVQGK